jgi:hypothetical protein
MSTTNGTQAALDLFELDGVRDLELFSEFVDVMRRHHRGREKAIPSAYLSRLLFGHPDGKSTIRDWKQVALHQLGLPIAYERGAGYYVVETEAELEDVLDYYYKRITSMKDSARAYEEAVTGSHTRRIYPDE